MDGKTMKPEPFWKTEEKRENHRVLYVLLGVLIICALLYAWGYTTFDQRRIHSTTGLWYSKTQVVDWYDTYGWPGEGSREFVIRGNERQKAYVQQNWKPLPLSDRLADLVECDRDGYSIFRRQDGERFFPEIEDGAYFYAEDHGISEDAAGFGDDIVLAIFNYADNMIYYYEQDF